MSDIIKRTFENIDPEAKKRLDEKLKNGDESFGLYDVSGICTLKRVSENEGKTGCGRRYEPKGFKYCPYCGKEAKILY